MSARALAALALLALASPSALARKVLEEVPAEVVAEWTTRAWALDPDGHRAALERALDAPVWTTRAAALDALARAAASGASLPAGTGALARAKLSDPHPNVRARALALFTAAPELALPDSEQLEQLAADPLPALRMELAQALGVRASLLEPAAAGLLARLALDADARTAAVARAGLLALPGPTHAAELIAVCSARGSAAECVDLAELVARTRGLAPTGFATESDASAAWTAELRGALAGASDAQRALLEAALLLAGADGDEALLARGWASPAPSGAWSAFLAKSARYAGPELAAPLLAWLAGAPEVVEDAELRDLERAWIDAASDAAGGAVLEDPLAGELSPERATLLLQNLVTGARELDPDALEPWLAPARTARERAAAVRLLTSVVNARDARGERAGVRLARLLDDPDAELARDAWFALAVANDPSPWLASLHSAWLARGAPLADLVHLTRDTPPTPFRPELLALGERGGEERSAVLDLLESFEGDAEVAEALGRWLVLELAAFDVQQGEDAGWRSAELRAMGALRALAHLGRAEDADVVESALDWSRGRSTQVGKVAAATLARLPSGLARLPEHLGDGEDRRTRIEVAIALVRAGTELDARDLERAIRVLESDLAYAAWDLRVRMVDALGRAATHASRAVLERALFDVATEPSEQPGLINALVAGGGDAALAPVLVRVVRDTDELGPRRAAVLGLGRIGAAGELAELELEFEEEARVPGVQGEAAQLLADEARQLRAELGTLTPEERGAVVDRPLASAAEDLSARFHGETSARTQFRWRTELEVASALAERGELGEALEEKPWWRMDRALLRALGERARGAEPETARRLLRGAHVALLGEPEPAGRERSQLLARERELASEAGDTPARDRAESALEWARRQGPNP